MDHLLNRGQKSNTALVDCLDAEVRVLQVSSIDDFEEGKEYVCAGKGEAFKKIEYCKVDTKRSKKLSNCKFIPQPKIVPPDCVRPRIVTIIRNGLKPRKVSCLVYFPGFLVSNYLFSKM